MAFNKFDKCIMSLTLILVITSVIINIVTYIKDKPLKEQNKRISLYMTTNEITEDMRKLVSDTNLFKDIIYDTDEIILTYSYKPLSVEKNSSEKFHKAITKEVEKNNIKVKLVPYVNGDKYLNDALAGKQGKKMSCSIKTPSSIARENFEDCFKNACLFDNKNNQYILLGRDVEHVINNVKSYLSTHK